MVAADDAGSAILAWVGKAAAVFRYTHTRLFLFHGHTIFKKTQTNTLLEKGKKKKKKSYRTDITACPLPARGTYAFEGVSFIIARTAIVTCRLVTLALTWQAEIHKRGKKKKLSYVFY